MNCRDLGQKISGAVLIFFCFRHIKPAFSGYTTQEKAVIFMERFSCGGEIVTGPGGVQVLKELELGKVLVVCDPFFYQNGTAQTLVEGAGEYFYDIRPDPPLELVARGTALVKAHRPDTVIALGGGSAMDCAKAMVYFGDSPARLIAIPTTSGSGSEVTDFAILTHQGEKHPLVDRRLRPEMAIVDPDLVSGLPPALVADGGFDVLTHCAEAYVATNAGPFSQALAADAFRSVLHGLRASFRGDLSARASIHAAATMAGLAFTQAGLGLCHSLSHALGGRFHIPHGRLNAVLLPAVMSRSPQGPYASLAHRAGLEGTSEALAARNLRTALVTLRKAVGLPATLAQAGVDPAEVRRQSAQIAEAAIADPCSRTHPIPVTRALVTEILQEVTGHG